MASKSDGSRGWNLVIFWVSCAVTCELLLLLLLLLSKGGGWRETAVRALESSKAEMLQDLARNSIVSVGVSGGGATTTDDVSSSSSSCSSSSLLLLMMMFSSVLVSSSSMLSRGSEGHFRNLWQEHGSIITK